MCYKKISFATVLAVDIALFVELERASIRKAFGALASLGYRPRVPVTAEEFADKDTRQRWIEEKGMRVLNLCSEEHRETPIDLFVEEPFAFSEGWDNALVEELDGGPAVRFVDIDRLIAMKEGTGRAKDLDDIQHLEELRDDDA